MSYVFQPMTGDGPITKVCMEQIAQGLIKSRDAKTALQQARYEDWKAEEAKKKDAG